MITPRTVSGTLELLPRDQMRFQHLLNTIQKAYESYGFVPVETPVFEQRDILLTKSGGETEKQVYFVQSTGSAQQGHDADLALRFDLTIPLARYVAEHERDLAFPFRRYQIQRVYRGERAQKGRFREFYQCDIDIIGKDKLSPAFDAELPAIIASIFTTLGIPDFCINFSNRKILLGFMSALGVSDAEQQKLILREIDKLDKIGAEKVRTSIAELGLNAVAATRLLTLVTATGSKDDLIALLKAEKIDDPLFVDGLNDVAQMVSSLRALGVPENQTRLNLAIARGLDYYTGTVYETTIASHPEFGSVCSGGRYENLASHYTRSNLPGVGISIGATRLFDVLRTHNLLPPSPHIVQILIPQVDEEMRDDYLSLGATLRRAGFTVETYLEPAKLDKQLKYANKSGIPVALLYGGAEKENNIILVKDLDKQTQKEVALSDLIPHLKALFS